MVVRAAPERQAAAPEGGGAAGAGAAPQGNLPGTTPVGNPPVKSAGLWEDPHVEEWASDHHEQRKEPKILPQNPRQLRQHQAPTGSSSETTGWGGKAEDVDTGQTVTRDTWAYFGLKKLDTEKTAIFVCPGWKYVRDLVQGRREVHFRPSHALQGRPLHRRVAGFSPQGSASEPSSPTPLPVTSRVPSARLRP